MKIFIAGLSTETNSFSPIPTGRESFEEGFIAYGDATSGEPAPFSAPLHVWRKMAEADGHEVVEGLCAYAQPAGPTVRTVYEEFREEILANLNDAGPVDIVLLALHGAMIADGYDDCEGDLLQGIRRILGPDGVLGAELDAHAHLTDEMMEAASFLVTFKEYPHTDIPERAEDLYRLALRAAAGEVRPVMRDWDCRMVYAYHTTREPMRSFVDRMKAMEGKDGILSVSLVHSFPWGDTVRTGTRALVTVDAGAANGAEKKAEEAAEKTARALAEELFGLRESIRDDQPSIEETLAQLESGFAGAAAGSNEGPVVLADVADNAGGGAPSDATFLLRALIEGGYGAVAAGIFWDPVALRFCREAGEGAVLKLRLGGKCGAVSGDPLDLKIEVVRIKNDVVQHFGSIPSRVGSSARLRLIEGPSDFDIIVNDRRTQTFHPEVFTAHDIDISEKRIVAVKSSQHFYAGFAPIASRVIHVATPGAISPDFASIPYVKKKGPYWPRIADPFT